MLVTKRNPFHLQSTVQTSNNGYFIVFYQGHEVYINIPDERWETKKRTNESVKVLGIRASLEWRLSRLPGCRTQDSSLVTLLPVWDLDVIKLRAVKSIKWSREAFYLLERRKTTKLPVHFTLEPEMICALTLNFAQTQNFIVIYLL